jgi:hypothetical protein
MDHEGIMKRFLMLVLGLGGVFGLGCKSHQHGLAGGLDAGTELLTIDLTSGLG